MPFHSDHILQFQKVSPESWPFGSLREEEVKYRAVERKWEIETERAQSKEKKQEESEKGPLAIGSSVISRYLPQNKQKYVQWLSRRTHSVDSNYGSDRLFCNGSVPIDTLAPSPFLLKNKNKK